MKRKMYFGLTELGGDLFIIFSLNKTKIVDTFNEKEKEVLYALKEKDVYLVVDSIYQPPFELDNKEVMTMLENDFIYSEKLDGLILKEVV